MSIDPTTSTFEDEQITCCECKESFTWTAGEQEFWERQKFTAKPKRCKTCRGQRKAARDAGGEAAAIAGRFPFTCAGCGKEDTVPFEPRAGRAVYCRACFQKQRRTTR